MKLPAIRRPFGEDTASETSHTVDRREVLRLGARGAAAAVAVPAVTGTAAAHFPAGLDVAVRPGSGPSPINPRSRGVVPVAVRRTDAFDPTSEDVRYRFGAPDVVEDGGGARPIGDGHVADVDGDGLDDLLLHFPLRDAGFDGDESVARLEWERTASGEHGLSGTDRITIVGRPVRRRG